MTAGDIVTICAAVPAIIGAITALIVAVKANNKAATVTTQVAAHLAEVHNEPTT
jgi:hypothetical protein